MEMSVTIVDEWFYLMGLLLVVFPLSRVAVSVSKSPLLRMIKLGLGLFFFAVGTMGLHLRLRETWGQSFLVSSILLLLLVSLIRVWWTKRDQINDP